MSSVLKSRPALRVPVAKLLEQYEDPAVSVATVNFTKIYLELGWARLSAEEQADIAPKLLSAVVGRSEGHRASAVVMAIPSLGTIASRFVRSSKRKKMDTVPSLSPELASLGLSDPGMRALFLQMALDVMLLANTATQAVAPAPGETLLPPPP